MSFAFDVVIVGGGPAGTSTALHLVRREGVSPRRIAILDRARFPRDKPCAGAISQLGIDVLADLGVSLDVPTTPMLGVRVLLGDEAGETLAPMGVCVRRTELDAYLLRTAEREGVAVLEGEGIATLDAIDGGFRVGTAERSLTARYVVAADGAGSATRKLLGLREPDRKGHLYVLDTPRGPKDAAIARGLIDFDLSVLADGLEGYYWDFPTPLDGTQQVSRGIYHANLVRPDTPAGESVKAVLARALARRDVAIADVKLRPFSTRPFVPASTTWVPGALLVGEACGIDQVTGEGIAQAIDMGRLAARSLGRAITSGTRAFADYDRALRRSATGRHLLQSAWMVRRVYRRIGRPAQRYLLHSDYARAVATRWYRGESLPWSTKARLGLGLATSLL